MRARRQLDVAPNVDIVVDCPCSGSIRALAVSLGVDNKGLQTRSKSDDDEADGEVIGLARNLRHGAQRILVTVGQGGNRRLFTWV